MEPNSVIWRSGRCNHAHSPDWYAILGFGDVETHKVALCIVRPLSRFWYKSASGVGVEEDLWLHPLRVHVGDVGLVLYHTLL